jgi:hypothetical protein
MTARDGQSEDASRRVVSPCEGSQALAGDPISQGHKAASDGHYGNICELWSSKAAREGVGHVLMVRVAGVEMPRLYFVSKEEIGTRREIHRCFLPPLLRSERLTAVVTAVGRRDGFWIGHIAAGLPLDKQSRSSGIRAPCH